MSVGFLPIPFTLKVTFEINKHHVWLRPLYQNAGLIDWKKKTTLHGKIYSWLFIASVRHNIQIKIDLYFGVAWFSAIICENILVSNDNTFYVMLN